MPKALNIRGLLCDFDGTIVDSLSFAKSIYREMTERLELPSSEQEFEKFNGLNLMAVCKNLVDRAPSQITAEDLHTRWISLLKSRYDEAAPTRSAKQLFDEARENGWRTAIVSSAPTDLISSWLRKNSIAADVIVGAGSTPKSKPFADPYLEAMRSLGLQPESCIAVEDSLLGAQSALSAGITTFSLYEIDNARALRIASLSDLLCIVNHKTFQKHAFDELRIRSEGDAPPLPAEISKIVDTLWDESVSHHPGLFDEKIFSFLKFDSNAIDGHFVPYRRMRAVSSKPALRDQIELKPLAISGVAKCSDGIIIGKRAVSVSSTCGLWEFCPSGGINAEHVSTAGDVDFYSLILSELLDEVGIPKDFVKSIRISEGYENVFSGLLDLIADMEIDLSSDQVISLHKKNATEEYDEIRVIKEKDIKAFCSSVNWSIVDVTYQLMKARYFGN
jgi:beta-phosphoglucomutase-like phosphatase (HAD superfamily)